MFHDVYTNKRVLVTGHTGFKGAWLTCWLLKLGAKVAGLSNEIPTSPAMFEELELENKIDHHFGDVRDYQCVKSVVDNFQPDFIFHLAAQPIVSLSYQEPLDTITTNVVGTAVVLDVLRNTNLDCIAIIITSDKCYENVEWEWGYKETDHMGGRDIYSGSKGAAEVIFHAYYHSFFTHSGNKVRLATGRAGNVIGGGDWAKDRIVADCMRSWSEGEAVEIRSPSATRPWQHVLEPLSGYLTLGASISKGKSINGESFNFGPRSEQNHTVLELLSDLSKYWDFEHTGDAYHVTAGIPFHEASLLKLNCDKALFHLKWEANLTYAECVRFVSEWYFNFYREKTNMYEVTVQQISEYEKLAEKRALIWTNP